MLNLTNDEIDDIVFKNAVNALASYIANGIVNNATDNEEDPLTYATDEEIVNLYANEIASAVSEALPNLVKIRMSL
jgi:hypothetical protein